MISPNPSDPKACLSGKLGAMQDRVENFVREFRTVWRDAAPFLPRPEKIYPPGEKKHIERELAAYIERTLPPGNRLAALSADAEKSRLDSAAEEVRIFCKRLAGRMDLPMENVYDRRFVESTGRFLQAARNFDPEIEIAEVYQALRNVWIMNTLQFSLGIEVAYTEAVFAYSMVYPYLDNLLDDKRVSFPDKLGLLLRLRSWLEGMGDQPRGAREEKLRALIARIEAFFPRRDFPGVYQSMLAIYNGQIRSLLQQRELSPPCVADILAISLEKGGTSVLADGYLVAGRLSEAQERFCFGFGALLQLADDLQDVAEDLRNGHKTLFSQIAGRFPLDALVNKLFHFTAAVVDGTLDQNHPGQKALSEIIRRCCGLMYMESVGKYPRFFSRDSVAAFERTFPVRFARLAKLRRKLQGRGPTGREKIIELDPVTAALMSLSSRALALD